MSGRVAFVRVPLFLIALSGASGSAGAREDRPKPEYREKPGILASVGFDQKPNARIPVDLTFRDEAGKEVQLKALLSGRPIILNLVYYDCPLLCNQVLDSLVRSLNVLKYKVGRDFDVLSVSIDPRETPDKAMAKEADVLRRYTLDGGEARAGWHFLTGEESAIERLSKSVGFRFSYNPTTRLYAHPAGIVFLTPDGRASRYIYGLSYPARDLTLALSDASEGKIGGVVEQALLLCFVYDPTSGSYSFKIMMVVRVVGTLTALALFAYLFRMLRRDRRAARSKGLTSFATGSPPPVALN